MLKAEILSVGTELLMGQVANTNAQFLSAKLPEIGIAVYYHSVVGDNPGRLKKSLKLAFGRADVIITTGGLGPTQDDLTKQTIAEELNLKMVTDEESRNSIIDYFASKNKPMAESNFRQAEFPEGSIILKNGRGTAPGCAIKTEYEGQNKIVIMLPGPPREMTAMYESGVAPFLKEFSHSNLKSKFVSTVMISESIVEEMMLDLINGQTNPTFATYAKDGIVTTRVTAHDEADKTAEELLQNATEKLYKKFGDAIFTENGASIEEVLVNLLKEKKLKIVTAESCTGGLVAEKLTSVSGASDIIDCSFVTYCNAAKYDLLGVSSETLENHGAISEETAKEMALGAAKKAKADVAISITGCAGPSKSEGKPVGLVYIGIYYKNKVKAYRLDLNGNRERVRTLAAVYGMNFARLAVLKDEIN